MQLKYKRLIQNTLDRLRKQPNFIALAESFQFLFKEAQQIFKEFQAFEATNEFYTHFLKEYQSHKGGFASFLEHVKSHQKTYQLATLIARLGIYVDEKALHKKVFSADAPKRTLGTFKLWFPHWLSNCIQYKQQGEKVEGLLPIIQRILLYLNDPSQHVLFLKEEEQARLSRNLLDQAYDAKKFDKQFFSSFETFDIKVQLADNYACYLYFLLNQTDLKILWDYTEEDIYQQEVLAKHLSEDIVAYNAMQKTKYPLNQILYGPPGTGKTYTSIRYAIGVVEDKNLAELGQEAQILLQRRFDQYIKDQQIAFVTFHQSMSYEDFVEGIKPKVENEQVVYELQAGIFKQMAERAAQNPSKRYVLIIDEINRGNIATIFGELITLLEPDKRKDQAQSIALQLTYSKQLFSLTSNLYLIGTMNSADRNTERLDMALRRRFHFEELAPQTALLSEDLEGINLQKMLSCINQRIQILLDKEHYLGQAYFMNIGTFAELQEVFRLQIIPLLEEYFWGDYSKIGLILGEGFIEQVHWNASLFAKFPDENFSMLNKACYQIKAFPIPKEAYTDIYQNN